MKDKDEAHFSLPFLVGGCNREFVLKCFQLMARLVLPTKRTKKGMMMMTMMNWHSFWELSYLACFQYVFWD
jgi:hypothetical protein